MGFHPAPCLPTPQQLSLAWGRGGESSQREGGEWPRQIYLGKNWLSLAKTEMSVCILNQINVSEPEQGERNGSI